MAVEYEFDGLDLWEQRLAQAVEKQYPEEFRKMVIDVAVELEGRVKERTPREDRASAAGMARGKH